MHALDGAYVRLARAEEHLADLKVTSTALVDAELKALVEEMRANVKLRLVFSLELGPKRPVPLKYSVLIGETIYNLRACLDYLVYELALLDSGVVQNGTQFPTDKCPETFNGRSRNWLRGVNPIHTAAIERLQPYNGVNWTKWLQALSNPDKHRHLILTEHGSIAEMTASPDPAYIASDNPPPRVELNISAMFIAFDDGLPVIDALEEIKTGVAKVLDYFNPEFQKV